MPAGLRAAVWPGAWERRAYQCKVSVRGIVAQDTVHLRVRVSTPRFCLCFLARRNAHVSRFSEMYI
eukprot:scaffold2011_cov233-Pinguiococcus_pyrenoidosus.AAC.8